VTQKKIRAADKAIDLASGWYQNHVEGIQETANDDAVSVAIIQYNVNHGVYPLNGMQIGQINAKFAFFWYSIDYGNSYCKSGHRKMDISATPTKGARKNIEDARTAVATTTYVSEEAAQELADAAFGLAQAAYHSADIPSPPGGDYYEANAGYTAAIGSYGDILAFFPW
jgi:hypothetical protein